MVNNILLKSKKKNIILILFTSIILLSASISFRFITNKSVIQINNYDWSTQSSPAFHEIKWQNITESPNIVEEFLLPLTFEYPIGWNIKNIGGGEKSRINGKSRGIAFGSNYKKVGRKSGGRIIVNMKSENSSWNISETSPIKIDKKTIYLKRESENIVDYHMLTIEERPKEKDINYTIEYNWENEKYPEYYFTFSCDGSYLDKEVIKGVCLHVIETLELK